MLTSNDIVILTLTPIILVRAALVAALEVGNEVLPSLRSTCCATTADPRPPPTPCPLIATCIHSQYFSIATKSDPTAVLFGQFYAANMFSMALYIGNPTNIIVAQVCLLQLFAQPTNHMHACQAHHAQVPA